MLSKNYDLKSFCSLTDNFNIHYKYDLLDKKKADKYFNILEDKLEYLAPKDSTIEVNGTEFEIKRKLTTYGSKEVADAFTFTKCWDDNDIVSKVIRNIKHKAEVFTGLKFNYVVINRYKDGIEGIGYHRDRELGEGASITGVSLGAARDFQFKAVKGFYPQVVDPNLTINLAHGSIYVIKSPTNGYWKHAVPKRSGVHRPRISLTFRYV